MRILKVSIIIQSLLGLITGKYGKVLLGLALGSGILFSLYTYIHVVEKRAYTKGVKDTEYQVMFKAAKDAEKQQALLLKQTQEIDLLRHQLDKQQVIYQQHYEKGKQDAEAKANAVIRDIESKYRRLSISVKDNRSQVTGTSTSATNTIRRAELSTESSRFLIGLATKADNAIRELNLCKQTLHETRKTVDRYNKLIKK